jgi:hypothetical protein
VSAQVAHLIDGDRVQGADRDEHGQRRRPWETGWTRRRNRPLATQRGGQSAGTHHDQRWAGGGSLAGEGVQFGVGRGVHHEDRFGAELVEGAVGTAGDDGGQLADLAWGDWIGAGRGLGHGYAVDQHRAAHHGPPLGREGRTDHCGRTGVDLPPGLQRPGQLPPDRAADGGIDFEVETLGAGPDQHVDRGEGGPGGIGVRLGPGLGGDGEHRWCRVGGRHGGVRVVRAEDELYPPTVLSEADGGVGGASEVVGHQAEKRWRLHACAGHSDAPAHTTFFGMSSSFLTQKGTAWNP